MLELKFICYSLETIIPKLSMLQPNNRNCGVKQPNCNTHAKFERVLLVIYRDIHHFMNVIY